MFYRRQRGRSVLAGKGISLLAFALCTSSVFAQVPTTRQAELVHLVRQDCGSCHGLTLRGGLGPSLESRSLQRFTPELLAATILQGRPSTPMPPFKGILTEPEARWIAEQLLGGFPEAP